MKTAFATAILSLTLATAAFAEGQTHYVAVHVDQNDPQVMNMALNNVENLTAYYASIGDTAVVELVAYGPGLMMFVPDKSPVRDRISTMALANDHLTFAACGNTLNAMSKRAGHDVKLMDEAQVVPSGVVRLVQLQEDNYAYIRP